jgi:hypothetical protein
VGKFLPVFFFSALGGFMKRASFRSLLAVAVCLLASVAHAQGQRQETPVTVTNTAANPVPVTGQVNIGALPAIDAKQNGPWTVGITGTPTVQVDRETNYQRVETVTWAGQGTEAWTTNYTDKFSKFRVCVAHTGPNPIQVNIYSFVSGSTSAAYFTYDIFVIGSPNTVCRVYDLPGASIQVQLANTGGNASGIARFALVGY